MLLCTLAMAFGIGTLIYLLAPEMERFEGPVLELKERKKVAKGWKFHSRIYSTGFVLAPGEQMPLDRILAELKARDYTQASNEALEAGEFLLHKNTLTVFCRGYELPGIDGPSGLIRLRFEHGNLSRVEDEHRETPALTYSLEPILLTELLGHPPCRSTFVPLKEIPPNVHGAVIASEDIRFLEHHGIDFRGILRATIENLTSVAFKQGASTITQQLARTLFLTTERSYQRKIKEIAIAIHLERLFSKRDLFEFYLNTVYLGQKDGVAIHGVEEAARAYFGKSVRDITLAEAATLSGIIPAPNAYSPLKNPKRARLRRNIVLGLMAKYGMITPSVGEAARAEPVEVHPSSPQPERFGYFSGYVRESLKTALGEDAHRQGLTVYSSLDPVIQEIVASTLEQSLASLEKRFGPFEEPLQGAAFLMEQQSGRVLAVVGGRDFASSPYNRAFQSRRQPGSAFKPIAYAAALEGGEGLPSFGPASTLSNLRRTYQVKEGDWSPRNYDGDYYTTVTLAKALTKSLNVATVNLVEEIGPQRVRALARKMGLGNLKPVLSIGLGTNELSLARLTAAYATFPARGKRVEPQSILRAIDHWGNVVLEAQPPQQVILDPDVAALMVELLRDVVIFGTAWTMRAEGYYTAPSGGKTGTSQGENDAWYIGFTPNLTLGVWVGFDKPAHLAGNASQIAVPVWGQIMSKVAKFYPRSDFVPPDNLTYAWIDPFTGGLATSNCPSRLRVAFLKGETPKQFCQSPHLEPPPEEREGEADPLSEAEAPLETLPAGPTDRTGDTFPGAPIVR